MATLSFRVDLASGGRFGPGKRRLLQLIDDLGSISAAGRAMGMSYRRAWLLVEEVNASFREPLVAKAPGGSGGGGASLTVAGHDVLARLTEIETALTTAASASLRRLDALAVSTEERTAVSKTGKAGAGKAPGPLKSASIKTAGGRSATGRES